ncbi:hypothetical protein SPRG_16577, partial [Saprolegnia parasitica CBS 223.65]
MELEIHVRRARNLTFAASSIDPAALELRIQCSVNGDLRSSGSGKRSSSKGFDGYVWRGDAGVLRWHLSLADFRRLKSMRPTVKIYVFGIGAQVHTLGWFFLDLRTPDTALRWVKILNSKHHGEVYVKSQIAKASAVPAPATPQALPATTTTTTTAEHMAPESPECLVVGPIETATDLFLLTITLVNAREMTAMITKLLQKSSPTEIAAIKSAGFWLAYSLFDVLVQSDAFTSLESADFGLIRGVFRLQSSLTYLREHTLATPLPLFLCTIDRILGRVEVPLRALAELDLPAHAEGSYPFEPSHATKGTPLGVVDVALDLVLEARPSVETAPEAKASVTVEPTPSVFYGSIDYVELPHRQHLDADDGIMELTTSSSDESLRAPMVVAEHRDAVLMWTDGLSWLSPTARDDVTVTVGEMQFHATLLHDVRSAALYEDDGRAVGTIFYSYTSETPPPATLRRPGSPQVLVLQVRSIKAGSHFDASSAPVHVAFEAPLVETKGGPRLSTSRVSLRAKEDVDVEAAKTVFCHVQASQLQRPWQLHLETAARDSIAVATLSLAYLGMLKQSQRCDLCGEALAENTDHRHDDEPPSGTTFTHCEVYIPAVARPGSDTVVAVLHVVATLQDKYPIAPVYPPLPANPRPSPSAPRQDTQTHHDDNVQVSPTTAIGSAALVPALLAPAPTTTVACTCVATLATEKRHLAEKQRELQATHHRRMETLEAEWASREKDRVQTVRAAQHEYMALETELRKTLAELEQRERRLAHAEESARLQSELQKQETEANERRVKRETSATLQSMEAQLERVQ